MNNFSRQLGQLVTGPDLSQTDLARKSGITKSKISRLVAGTGIAGRDDLDKILGALANPADRTALVTAYVRDVCSPGALLHLQGEGAHLSHLKSSKLSHKAQRAVDALTQSAYRENFERIAIDLAAAFQL